MLRIGDDDIHVFLPGNRNECNYAQLRWLESPPAPEGMLDSRSGLDWLKIATDETVFADLVAVNEAYELAEALENCLARVEAKPERTTPPRESVWLDDDHTAVYPAMACGNICFGQYVQADEQMMLLHLSGNEKHLWKLVAILVRPETEKLYNNGQNEQWETRLRLHFDEIDARLVLEQFTISREMMAKRFPNLFPKPKEGDEPKKITFEQVRNQREAYDRKMVQYAKRPSEKEKQWHTPAWTFLEFIENDIITAKELEKARKQWEK